MAQIKQPFSQKAIYRFKGIILFKLYPYMIGKQDWSDIEVVCIVSTGRAGTKFLGEFFNKLLPNIVSKHEPSPLIINLANDYAARKLSEQHAIKELEFKRRAMYRYVRKKGAKMYIESNPRFFSLLSPCCRVFRNPKIIHVIRDGRDVVRSGMSRWWYQEDDITPRIKAIDFENDKYHDKWHKMSRFEKICWFWQKRVSIISEDIKGKKSITVKFEDIFDRRRDYPGMETILKFLDLNINNWRMKYIEKMNQKINDTKEYGIPFWREWDKEMTKKFDEIAGAWMKKYYSNYP